jgi:hypothetical protein
MWVPKEVEDIERAIEAGTIRETSSLDGKRAVPSDKKKLNDIAIDVAAMSTEGGSIVYGVGEDTNGDLTQRHPFALAGVADRINDVVNSSITEVPYIEVQEHRLPDDPQTGYIVVVVPQSARAPHQVSVKGEYRYYGRGATGNRLLGEGEVARLYAQRQQRELDLTARLREVHATTPWSTDDPDEGHVYAFAQPAVLDQGLWDRAVKQAGSVDLLQSQLREAARAAAGPSGSGPSFGGSVYWHALGADAWRMTTELEDPPRQELIGAMHDITINIDGRMVLFAGGVARRITQEDRRYLWEPDIANSVAGLMATAGAFYERAGYRGAVAVGVMVTNLRDATGIGGAKFITARTIPTSSCGATPRPTTRKRLRTPIPTARRRR